MRFSAGCFVLILPFTGNACFAGVSLNPELLQEWTRNSVYPCPPPFKATYSKDGKILTFFAAEHVFAPTEESGPAFSILRREIESFKPSAIVIERPVAPSDFSERGVDTQWRRCRNEGGKFTCGEPTYAGLVASKLGAVIIGGESASKERNAHLLKIMEKEELLVYYSILFLSGMKKEGLTTAERKKKLFSLLRRELDFEESEWSYAKLEKWLQKNLGRKASDVETSWIEPKGDAGASPTQKIAHKVDSIREPGILSAVEGALKTSDRAMVVYGSGHFIKQAPVYENALGAPKFECLSRSLPSRSEEGQEEPMPTETAR